MPLSFPSNPSNGQEYLAENGFVYVWNSTYGVWDKKGNFVRPPKVLTVDGYTPNASGIITQTVTAAVTVGVDSYKAYTTADSFPNYTEYQFSTNLGFTTISYATTTTARSITLGGAEIPSGSDVYVRARQFVGSSAAAAPVGGISTYSRQPIKFTTASTALFTPNIVSIAGTTQFPVYQIGFAATTLPTTATYTGAGSPGNLRQVEWRVTGPRNPDSTGDTALAEVGIGTFSSVQLANALVLAMPFSGATGVGVTSDVNNAIRTASGASAGTTKTITNSGVTTASIGTGLTAHYYPNAAYFDGGDRYLTVTSNADFALPADFTFECWYYAVSWSGSSALSGLFNIGAYNTGLMVRLSNTYGYELYINSSQFLTTGTGTAKLGTWTHLAVVRKDGIVSVYENGIFIKNASNSGSISQNNIIIGASAHSLTEDLTGYLQDVKLYKGLAKYTENFTPPLPTYGTISYTTNTTNVGIATSAFLESTGDIPTAEASSTAANALVLAMPMNRTFGFQDINVAIRGLTSGASAGTVKTVGLGTTSTPNAPTHPIISSSESKWYDGSGYFGNNTSSFVKVNTNADFAVGTSDFCVEFWVNIQTWSSNTRIFLLGQSGTDGLAIGLSGSSSIFANIQNSAAVTTYNWSPSLNRWYHIALTRNGSSCRLFIDGILVSSGTNSGSITQNNVFVTGLDWANGYGLIGYMQDLKFYKGFAKYTANFTPPQPICGFTTNLAIQTGFTTTTAASSLLSSVVGLGSTSTLSFAADQTYVGITSITSSSGITTLPDPYASSLVLALPLANITGAGGAFTNDRNTQIRTTSLVGGGTTKTITNTGVTTVSLGSTNLYYGNIAQFGSGRVLTASSSSDFNFGTGDFTVEYWLYRTSLGNNDAALTNFSQVSSGYFICLHAGTGFNDASLYLNGSMVVQGGTPQANVWNHYAYVRSSGNCRIYKNGILIASTTSSATAGATNVMNIGAYSDGTSAVTGYMQDVRIYNGLAKYTTNFTPPPPMFGDYTRSTPNKIVFTPGSDYALEVKNTSVNSQTTNYSAIRQWGTKPKGGIYDPYASNLVLAVPGNNTTGFYDVTGQIKLETPTSTYAPYRYSSTNGLDINKAVDGVIANATTTNLAGTATFVTGISYNSLLVVYGNMANGSLGNPASGATLSVNGSNVTATGTYALNGYNATYHKYYETNTPGTLNSVGITTGVGGSHESGIYEIFVNGSPLLASLDSTSITGGNYRVTSPSGTTYTNRMLNPYGSTVISATQSKYYGRSIYFDGVDDYLEVPMGTSSDLKFGTSDFTVECWIYYNALTAYTTFLDTSNGGGGGTGWFMELSNTRGYFFYYPSGSSANFSYTISTGQWYHVAACRKNGVHYAFVNGILLGTITNTVNMSTGNDLRIGNDRSNTYDLNGYINDIRIYKGVAKYTSNFTPPNQIYLT